MQDLETWAWLEPHLRLWLPAPLAQWPDWALVALILGCFGLLVCVVLWCVRRLLWALRPQRPLSELTHKQKVYVERVVDGDTFVARLGRKREHQVKIRVLGIDTPESRKGKKVLEDAKRAGSSVEQQLSLGRQAKARAVALLESHHVVLEGPKGNKPIKRDVYGRFLAYVRLKDRKDYGLVLIEEGLAEDFGWKYPHPRKAAYQKAQKKAPNLLARKSWWRRLLRR